MNPIQPSNPDPLSQPQSRPVDEPVSLRGPVAVLDALLREPEILWRALRGVDAIRVILILALSSACCALLYGLVVGSFSKGAQIWVAPVKVTTGLFLSGILCLPSLHIFASLGGARARIQETIGMAAGLITLTSLLLLGFAPAAWVFSESTDSAAWMGAMHLGFWFVACYFGCRFVVAGFQALQTRSLAGVRIWLLLFVVVSLQMSTALRPILGSSEDFLPREKRFFLKHWMIETQEASN